MRRRGSGQARVASASARSDQRLAVPGDLWPKHAAVLSVASARSRRQRTHCPRSIAGRRIGSRSGGLDHGMAGGYRFHLPARDSLRGASGRRAPSSTRHRECCRVDARMAIGATAPLPHRQPVPALLQTSTRSWYRCSAIPIRACALLPGPEQSPGRILPPRQASRYARSALGAALTDSDLFVRASVLDAYARSSARAADASVALRAWHLAARDQKTMRAWRRCVSLASRGGTTAHRSPAPCTTPSLPLARRRTRSSARRHRVVVFAHWPESVLTARSASWYVEQVRAFVLPDLAGRPTRAFDHDLTWHHPRSFLRGGSTAHGREFCVARAPRLLRSISRFTASCRTS